MSLTKKAVWKLLVIFLIILCSDFLTKWWTIASIPLMKHSPPSFPYGGIVVFKNWIGVSLSINHVTNFGGAWGMFAAYHTLLFVVRIIIAALLLMYLIFYNHSERRQIPYVLIIAGAAGNIADVVLHGCVVDMIHFTFSGKSYGIFNLADVAIFAGVFSLFIQSLFEKRVSCHSQGYGR